MTVNSFQFQILDGGTVPESTIEKRRKANKVARASRRKNR